MNDSLMTAGLRRGRGAKFGFKDSWNEVNICSVKIQLRAYGGSRLFMQTWFLKTDGTLCYLFTLTRILIGSEL